MIFETVTYPPKGVTPLGVIEIVHGMCEHRHRYEKTIERFNKLGFICAIYDLRGHGDRVLTDDDLGYFSSKGYRLLLQDLDEYTMHLKREYPNLPIILIGHSMGSLISRVYLKKHSKDVDAVVLSGTPSDVFGPKFVRVLIHLCALFRGWRYRSPFISKLIFGRYNKIFSKEGIRNSWICSDMSVVDKFDKDKKCGFMFTLNGYNILMSLMMSAYNKMGWISKNKDLPIMFISGADDPCRVNDDYFKKSVLSLKRMGFPNTYSKLYQDMRHEVFNEPNNDEVFDDIMKFLEFKANIDTQTDYI